MEKIVKRDWREVRQFKLPTLGITVECYSSLILSELRELDLKPDEKTIDAAVKSLTKLIKSWNFFASETDEKPLPINEENISYLSIDDITYLYNEIQKFSGEVKKN